MIKTVLKEPFDITTQEEPRPEPQRGEILLKVHAVALCGSDLRIWNGEKTGNVQWPATIGHEVAGEVASVGPEAQGFEIGESVSVAPWFNCGECRFCLRGQDNLCDNKRILGYQTPGGLAEYTLIPEQGVKSGNLVKTSGRLGPESYALAEPLACVYHGHVRCGITDSSVVLIMGGGPIGLFHLQLALAAGARTVIVSDPSTPRRSMAESLGAHVTVNPRQDELGSVINEITDGVGVDISIICIGFGDLVNDAIALTAKDGLVNLFAGFGGEGHAEIDLNGIHYKHLNVLGNAGATLSDYHTAVKLLEQGQVDVKGFVTHTFPLDETARALDTAASGDAIKVAVVNE